jgi:hypothetical protein
MPSPHPTPPPCADLASPETFERFFQSAANIMARVTTLGAWRNSGLEPTPSLERLAETNPGVRREPPSLISADDH